MSFINEIGNISVFLVEPSNVQAHFIQARLGELGVQRIRVFHEGAAAFAAMPEFPPPRSGHQRHVSQGYDGRTTGGENPQR